MADKVASSVSVYQINCVSAGRIVSAANKINYLVHKKFPFVLNSSHSLPDTPRNNLRCDSTGCWPTPLPLELSSPEVLAAAGA